LTIADLPGGHPVSTSALGFQGRVWDVVTDTVVLPGGEEVVRDVVLHPSAVAVLALDDQDRVLLVHQYRHPARATLWELPAGLLDVAGEDPRAAASRELWEETHHEARRWDVLVDFMSSPGFCDEAIRIYLARDVQISAGAEHPRHGEERDMPVAWAGLDELAEAILGGGLHNPTLVVGVLAASAARARGWTTVRPADAPWALGPRAMREGH
jgi:8-oxo-dGTP pyrophosphatase MutT (NUDIX family)